MAQHAILRFEKHKGHPAGPLEAHHERKKEQYASNPDIDTSRSKYNFHIVKPDGRYYHFIQSRIEQARCRTRKDSTRFVDTLITASPEFFKGKSPKEIGLRDVRVTGRIGMIARREHLHSIRTGSHRSCERNPKRIQYRRRVSCPLHLRQAPVLHRCYPSGFFHRSLHLHRC